ncbi:hypothetical protein B9Z55_004983 [Caenorhabditis nigoni]|uniref:DNA-directed DNA polymerase n=2 Tax=Caenorhabditis nigoni TaxID=1611254 RepID=A0A2G5UZM1_9PELO|nr:hypothetical protein B9Z55_004983 [Caenorhabditis nigoni]
MVTIITQEMGQITMNTNQEVVEVLEYLLGEVVGEEDFEENQTDASDGEDEVVEMSGEERQAADDDSHVEQQGGSHVSILNVRRDDGHGDYKDHFKTVRLTVDLLDGIVNDPQGPENFGEMVVDLIRTNLPTNANDSTRAGVTFSSPELDSGESVGLSITPITRINAESIVRSMELMTQSNKSPLELQNPRLEIVIKYLIPPTGSGKRRSPFTIKDVMENNYFGKRTRQIGDEDDTLDFLMDEADEGEESEESSEEEEEDDDDVVETTRKARSTIMNNDGKSNEKLVEKNIEVFSGVQLPPTRHPSSMDHQKDYGETLEERTRGNRLYKMSLKKRSPNNCAEIHREVSKMKKAAGVVKNQHFDFSDIEKFQTTIFAAKLQIIAIVKDQATPYFAGPYVGEKKTIAIFLEQVDGVGHFSGVRKLPVLLGTRFYCVLCNTRSGSFEAHYNCPLRHRVCGAVECPMSPEDLPLCCVRCEMVFRSKTCLENHNRKGPRNGKSRCEATKVCKRCGEAYYTNKSKVSQPHDCGLKWCKRCNCKMTPSHNCIMAISKKKENCTHLRFVCDFESMADPQTGEQIPVLFVALRYCPECSTMVPKTMDDAKEAMCSKCSPDGRLKVIECISPDNRMVNVAEEATQWIFGPHNKGFVGLAHNASGYDWQFILNCLISKTKATPKVVTAGTKIIYLHHKGVRLLDSFKYLTMSLAAVGKAFQIPTPKGDFPIHFIQPENFDYIGDLPDDEFYNLRNKTPAAKEKLLKFLEEERAANKVFDFQLEVNKYCYDDVFILASALIPFEKDFEKVTNVCLFEESVTAASAAIKVFQRNHLVHEKPIVLDARPSVSIKSSIVSQKFLAWFGKENDVQVEMSTTFGERKVGPYRVDGFVDKCAKYPRGLVNEFFGCYFHAHKCTYSDQSLIGNKTAKDIREGDAKRIAFLETLHEVKVVWECDVENERRPNPEMAEFFADYEPLGLLECERALVGGRTEVFKLFVQNERQYIRYGDVVSLYPTVMKHEEFPYGPPKNVSASTFKVPITMPHMIPIRGFIACRVLAPRQLKTPLIPIKTTGKLVFALCLACAKSFNQGTCTHTDKERSFNGVFTTVELKKALELGYSITTVYHAVQYQYWAKNDEEGVGGLFSSYINQMMVEKIYSSGWPSNVKTPEEQDEFIRGYKEKEGILVNDKSRFAPRPGARLAAKLLLNSLWGKLAQRVDRPTTEIVVSPAKFWKIFHNTAIVMEDVWCINNTMMVRCTQRTETLESLKTGAVHIAAYVTSYARLRLYRLMEKVGAENIVYTDTDSIVYTSPRAAVDPLRGEHGPYLGQLTDELEGTMTEFVSLGPKTYCYKETLADGTEKTVRKAKGISLTAQADKKITFERMKAMVDEVLDEAQQRTVIQVPQQTMRRDRNHVVYAKENKKAFRFTFNKRRVLGDGSTLPFGYCDN